MRILLLVVWMLIPVGVVAYHLGPGQKDLKRDQAAQIIADAEQFASEEDWENAQKLFKVALEKLPDDALDVQRRVRLELAKCQMENKQLSQANEELKVLVNELVDARDEIDSQLLADSRTALANSQYYLSWLMRLEGLPREKWEPEITVSQQLFRLLAEQAEEQHAVDVALDRKKDLEAAVKLARMDLGELQGLPLPSQ
jgi:tetratricopeptide (TPR) repeat protein